jgi:hypothetical protein
MIRKILSATCALSLLAGCATTTTTGGTTTTTGIANPLFVELSDISQAGLGDLARVEAIASVPNPGLPGGVEDQAGLTCAQAGTSVLTQVNAVNAAANGPGAGVLSVAEVASLFQPGSPSFNQAEDTLATGCVDKANAVLGAAGVLAAGGVVAAMVASPQILPLLVAGHVAPVSMNYVPMTTQFPLAY